MSISKDQIVSEHVPDNLQQLDIWQRAYETSDGCWELGYTYPQVNIKGKTYRLSRLISGAPKGLLVYFTCDNRRCFRPSHLFTRTHEEKHKLRMERFS